MFSFLRKRKDAKIITQTRDNYNLIAASFNSTRQSGWPEFKYIEEYIVSGQRIFDWGCGNGRYFEAVKDKKIFYYGADISRELIKFARAKYQSQIESGQAEFVCTENGEINFPNNFFDLVIMIASFHHLPSFETRLELLKKINKEMKLGGRIVMTNWNLGSIWALNKKLKPGWKELSKNDFLVPWKDKDGKIITQRYYHSFSKAELKDLLSQAGFKVEISEFSKGTAWSDDNGGRNLITTAVKI